MASDHNDNAFPNALEQAINQTKEYQIWKRSMSPLKDVPEIQKYKNNYKKSDKNQVSQQIGKSGALIPRGQVLFHGGTWYGPNPSPRLGDQCILDGPLSTTLSPQVAAVHAFYRL
jgi:hypothetical protein